MGSLTGAVASQNVTEAHEGSLSAVGNRATSVKAQGSLTARETSRAGTKVGLSDPAVPYGRAVAQRIKGTPGITGLSPPRVRKLSSPQKRFCGENWLKSVKPIRMMGNTEGRKFIIRGLFKTSG